MRAVLRLVTPATDRAVSIQEARRHLRAEDTDSDDLIDTYLRAAEQSLAFVGRAMKPATYALDLYHWRREIELPMPPLRNVSVVNARGTDGTLSAADPSLYSVTTTSEGRGIVLLASGFTWQPFQFGQVNASVEFTAGYDEVPAALRAAILLSANSLYDVRADLSPVTIMQVPNAVQRLVAPYVDPVV